MSTRRRPPRRLLAAGLLAGLLAALVAVGAFGVVGARFAPVAAAHAQLMSSIPTDGATLDRAPASAELVFNEQINPEFAQIVVADAAQVAHTMTPTVAGPKVTTPLPEGLPKGKVAVRYRVVSKDGHPISGQVVFTLTEGRVAGPAAGAPAGGASAAAEPDGAAASTTSGSAGWVYALSGVAALVLLAVGAFILRWDRQSRA